jgi:hypothetical protein
LTCVSFIAKAKKDISRILHEASSSSVTEELEENMQEEETGDAFETCETSGTNDIHVDEFEDSLLFEQVRVSLNYL